MKTFMLHTAFWLLVFVHMLIVMPILCVRRAIELAERVLDDIASSMIDWLIETIRNQG